VIDIDYIYLVAVMFNPNGERSSRIFMRILRFTPIALIYQRRHALI